MNLAEVAAVEAIGGVCALSRAINFINATEVSHSVFNKAEDAICKWLTYKFVLPSKTNSNLTAVAAVNAFSRQRRWKRVNFKFIFFYKNFFFRRIPKSNLPDKYIKMLQKLKVTSAFVSPKN